MLFEQREEGRKARTMYWGRRLVLCLERRQSRGSVRIREMGVGAALHAGLMETDLV